jgi:transposase-like protein
MLLKQFGPVGKPDSETQFSPKCASLVMRDGFTVTETAQKFGVSRQSLYR